MQILKSIIDTRITEANLNINTLEGKLKQNQIKTANVTDTQVNNLQNIISLAQKTPNITATEKSCLQKQKNALSLISSSRLSSCYSATNSSRIVTSRKKLNTLSSLSLTSWNYCHYLNPLNTQLPSLSKCLENKISDINQQIVIVDNELYTILNETLKYSVNCHSEVAGSIFNRLGLVNYEINLCFFKFL